jgi:heme-degrading monooxygenase HmoA
MYLTMNRFRIRPGQEQAFEAVWTGRESRLPEVPGFVSFHLFRGPARADHTLYASHTLWRSEADFHAWTRSEAFRAAHAGAGDTRDLYLGPPDLECFDSVQAITA